MKIIEAMKRVKQNKEKIGDLQLKIGAVSANLSIETPVYGDQTSQKVKEWAQSCDDLTQDNIRLLCAVQRTNLATSVTIKLGEKDVTKSISEWVWRRREYALIDYNTWAKMTDRGLKEGPVRSSTEVPIEVKIQRHYDPLTRDRKMEIYKSEPREIDSALEVVNAVTDLIEA